MTARREGFIEAALGELLDQHQIIFTMGLFTVCWTMDYKMKQQWLTFTSILSGNFPPYYSLVGGLALLDLALGYDSFTKHLILSECVVHESFLHFCDHPSKLSRG